MATFFGVSVFFKEVLNEVVNSGHILFAVEKLNFEGVHFEEEDETKVRENFKEHGHRVVSLDKRFF